MSYCFLHFVSEETEARKCSDTREISQCARVELGSAPGDERQACPRCCCASPGGGAEEGSFWICYQVYDIGTHHRRPRLGPISREAIKCIECDGGSSNKSLIFQNTYCE